MHVLVVEDDARLAEALARILEDNGYTTDVVHDGEAGVRYGETGTYDVIILDVMLPKADGFTVAQRLRRAHVGTPILLLTARDAISDKICGYDSGADDYMTKPFNPQELLARIRAMTRSPLAKEPNRLSMGNVSLDLASYELSTPAGSFRLTSKEFQMMEMLLANPRRLIPTERFLEKIWGYDTEAEIHVVWVYISYLRKKLASLQANVQIRVARNAGYSLEEIP